MDADFKTSCLHHLRQKKAHYTYKLYCIASSAVRRTWNNLSVKICEDLRPIYFYHFSHFALPNADFDWWALNSAPFQGVSWGLPLCGRSISFESIKKK